MKIAYVLNTYPQPSHSFIRRELAALGRQGVSVVRIAMRPAAVQLADPRDRAEQARTGYVLKAGALRLLASLARAAAAQPRRFGSALGLALRLARVAETGRLRHIIYLAEAAHVARRVRAEGLTHLHAHFGTNAATVAMLAGLLADVPFSFTVHGPEEFDAPRALALGEKASRAAFTVAVSQFGRSQLCRWVPFEHWDRLAVVHCGIEPEAFAAPKPLPEGPLRLVSIGRLAEQKGQVALIEAMALLRETHPDVHLTLVGDGELRTEIERAIAGHGLSGHVTLAGWLGQDGVIAALNNAHALVMPSFAEGLPMVVMEAMAAERAVIATYVAGTPELVAAGETGWLVPAGSPAALCEAMAEAADSPAGVLLAMGQAGRARVLARHDIDVEAAKLKALFAGV